MKNEVGCGESKANYISRFSQVSSVKSPISQNPDINDSQPKFSAGVLSRVSNLALNWRQQVQVIRVISDN